MYWANFLHIYQPPTQSEEIVRRVAAESYRTLVRVLEAAPSARITLNISGCLTEQLARYHLDDVIEGLGRLAQRGQIEFTGSAMYHPILPLIPEEEVKRQIDLNAEANRRYFGDLYNPRGFFPPEMCYSPTVAAIAAELGYRWIIVDETGHSGHFGTARTDAVYCAEGLDDFHVFFKERPYSAGITYGAFPTAEAFLRSLRDELPKARYLLTGTDGEVYGHHRPGQERLLEEIFARGEPPTCTISDLLTLFAETEMVTALPSGWSTWEDEMAAGVPYPKWDYPGNELHDLQWRLTHLAIRLVRNVPATCPGYAEARQLLDEGLHSCQYWWASCRPWWNPDMIERGARQLYGSVEAVRNVLPEEVGAEARLLFEAIQSTVHEWQETGRARRLGEQYLREHPQVTSRLTFG